MTSGSGINKLLLGAIGTLSIGFGGWTVNQIADHSRRLQELEAGQVRIVAVLESLQASSIQQYRSTSQALVRLENKVDRLIERGNR